VDKPILRPSRGNRFRVPLVLLITGALLLMGHTGTGPAWAQEGRSLARIDIVLANGGILDPLAPSGFSAVIRADESGSLNSGEVTVTLTEEAFSSEDQIRRYLVGTSSPLSTVVGSELSPDVPQLESREMVFPLPPDLWTARLGLNSEEDEEEEDRELAAGIFGLEITYRNPANLNPALRELTGRQLVVVVPPGTQITPTTIAPIVTLTTSPIGGLALRPEELQALTLPDGPLEVVTSALAEYPATVAVDSRITASIAALGELAPPESIAWANGLDGLGLAQFSLPWADADPLGSLEIDTLVYARLGEYPWVHGEAITTAQLNTLQTRSASAVLLSSASVPSDRAVVAVGSTRVIRVDAQLSQLASDALQAPTSLEAEADLQRAQGIIAFRALTGNQEVLVFSAGRLPASTIAAGISSVLERFSTMTVATTVAVPFDAPATEVLSGIPSVPVIGEVVAFRRDVKALWEKDVAFATIAYDPGAVLSGRWGRYQSLLSSTWRNDPNGLEAEWVRAQEDSKAFQNSVRVEQGSAITVLSDQTSLPITVLNNLGSDAVVTLSVRSTTAILAVEQPLTSVSIPAGGTTRVFIPVQSLANGTVSVELLLLGPGGNQVGELVTLPITIRAGWEGVISVTLALLVGGTFGFGIVRALQRRRAEKLSEGTAQ